MDYKQKCTLFDINTLNLLREINRGLAERVKAQVMTQIILPSLKYYRRRSNLTKGIFFYLPFIAPVNL